MTNPMTSNSTAHNSNTGTTCLCCKADIGGTAARADFDLRVTVQGQSMQIVIPRAWVQGIAKPIGSIYCAVKKVAIGTVKRVQVLLTCSLLAAPIIANVLPPDISKPLFERAQVIASAATQSGNHP